MPTFPPTAEQTAILDFIQASSQNLMVEARAGAAKTTTLEFIAEALRGQSVLSLAFNKKIADELQERMPSWVECRTLNGVGFRALRGFLRSAKVDKNKNYTLIREELEGISDPTEREEYGERLGDYVKAVGQLKSVGYLPSGTSSSAKPLIADDSVFDLLEIELDEFERSMLERTMTRGFKAAMRGIVDFDDQIYLPVLMPSISFDTYDTVLVDEAQDLSPINHAMLKKIVRRKRLIAVGDPCQAIYAFRGASNNSMNLLREAFDMQTLYLTVCFRSAQSIIEAARWRAPDMQWRPNAPIGEVQVLTSWSASTINDGDAVICRNNAPLFRLAIRLIGEGRYPELANGDIIKGLQAVMKKLGQRKTTSADAKAKLSYWQDVEQKRVKSRRAVEDKATCIRIFLDARPTLGEAQDFLASIAQRKGRIKLMTGHKAKGLEFSRVFFLDEFLISDDDQDPNVRYVIQTRAKDELVYVTSEGFRVAAEAA